jgi:Ca2+-transporting ATPase
MYGLVISISVIGAMIYALYVLRADATIANNIAFYTLLLAQLWHVFNLPKRNQSLFFNEITRNPFIWAALAVCISSCVVIYFVPVFQVVLKLQPLTFSHVVTILVFSILPVGLIQVIKRLGMIWSRNKKGINRD